jgi:UDP-N-acetylglucosamine--N-acetylmuramyl-(pentapeptide) pyrophosphoryl-undecaprenol N-acetylglucosamine transferase
MMQGRKRPVACRKRVLAVSTTGGHLAELRELLPRMLPAGCETDWVTFDTPQSRSVLAGERVRFVRDIHTRELSAILANLRPAGAIVRSGRYSLVVASGAAALSFLPPARTFGLGGHFIECATRTDGPSLTGRVLGGVPGVHRYTQHPGWAGRSWHYRGSVFDNFEPGRRAEVQSLRRVVVTLGMNPYPFRRLLERLVEILPDSAAVVWQTGVTDAAGLPIRACKTLPAHELSSAMAQADVVVAHAGTGSSLAALDAGRIPLVVPRRAGCGEQIDDHQSLLADDLSARGLAMTTSVEDLDLAALRHAAGRRAARRHDAPRFELV